MSKKTKNANALQPHKNGSELLPILPEIKFTTAAEIQKVEEAIKGREAEKAAIMSAHQQDLKQVETITAQRRQRIDNLDGMIMQLRSMIPAPAPTKE